MARTTFTITLDGKQIGKRTSATRAYTHAVLMTAQDPDAVIMLEEREALMLEGQVIKLRAALEAPKVQIRGRFGNSGDLGYNGQPVYHNYEIWLEGAGDMPWHANSKGEVRGGYEIREDGSYDLDSYDSKRIYSAEEFLAAYTRNGIQTKLERIAKCQARIDALASGDVSSLAGPRILSWHTSGPLAAKAASAARSYGAGSVPSVLPVDAR